MPRLILFVSFAERLGFRGYDKSYNSRNWGNFLELLQVLAKNSKDSKCCIAKCSRKSEDDISRYSKAYCVTARETRNAIVNNIGNEYFAILVDESWDVSIK